MEEQNNKQKMVRKIEERRSTNDLGMYLLYIVLHFCARLLSRYPGHAIRIKHKRLHFSTRSRSTRWYDIP